MLATERQNKILQLLKENKVVKIADIVEIFDVSYETVRRDIKNLEKNKLIRRVYGGILANEEEEVKSSEEEVISSDMDTYEKTIIGEKAASLVEEGDTILIGMGQTLWEVAKSVKNKKNITVLTNSIYVINELIDSQVDLYILGGHINSRAKGAFGQVTCQSLKNYYVDKAFVGAGGITLEGGVTDWNAEATELVMAMVEQARQTILVAQSRKFGKKAFSATFDLSCVEAVVTDSDLSEEYITGLQERGIQLLLANKEIGEKKQEI